METLKPMQGTWKLEAPDGHLYYADSPLACVREEMNCRVPPSVQLERVLAAADEPDFADSARCRPGVARGQPACSSDDVAAEVPMSEAKPRAWLCELAQEDGSVRTMIVEQDPDGLRFNDMDPPEPSPFRVTPLYEAPPGPIYVVEYGAIDFPMGHPSRITASETFATKEEAEAFAAEGDYCARVLMAFPLA